MAGGDVTQEEKGEELLQQEEEEDHGFTEDRTPAIAAHTALEVLFKDEDQALLKTVKINVTEKTKKEVQVYQSFPAVLSSADPIRWWRQKRDQCWPASLCPGLFYDLRAGKNPVGH